MSNSSEWTDVLIVGGGPVGMALALDLRYRGIDCMVVESGDGEVRHPKVSTIGPRSMELFRRWGLAAAIRGAGWPADHPLDIAWVTRVGGHEVHRYRRGTTASRGPFVHTPESDQICPAHWLNPLLQRAVGVHPSGPLRLRTTVEGVRQAADHVEANLIEGGLGRSSTVRAQFLVACDGAASPIRQACGIGAPPRHRTEVFRNILFRAPELKRQLGDRVALVYFLMLSSTLRFPMRSLNGSDLYNLVVGVDAAAQVDGKSLITDAIAFETPVQLLSDSEWHLTHRVADSYRAERVFLAGDAAHTLSPSGGFGLNTGFGDVADLGWKLAAALNGWAGRHLLDTYEAERRPIALESLQEANRNLQRTMHRQVPPELHADGPIGESARAEMASKLVRGGAHSEFDAPEIHFGLSYQSAAVIADPLVAPRPGKPGTHWRPGSDPGSRAAHAWWDADTSTLDLFGHDFVLMSFAESASFSALERAFAERHVPLTVRRGTDPEIAKLYDRPFVLVRPDGHVAWRGDDLPTDPVTFVDTVRGEFLAAQPDLRTQL